MSFHCRVCDYTFKKFVLFEGHFDQQSKCRKSCNRYMQCYICKERFRYSAALKYHLQQHSTKRVQKFSPKKLKVPPIPVIPKITLKKQWNFKIVPPIDDADKHEYPAETENPSLKCTICKKQYRSVIYLEQHLKMHRKKRVIRNRSASDEIKPNGQMVSVLNGHCDNNKSSDLETVATQSTSPNISFGKISTKRYKCNICNIELRYGGEKFARHMQGHKDGKFKCKICNIKFSRQSLHWHQKYVHRITRGQFSCVTCKATFMHRENLAKHMDVHINGTLECTICKIRFTTMTLTYHVKEMHPGIEMRSVQGPSTVATKIVGTNSVPMEIDTKTFGAETVQTETVQTKSVQMESFPPKLVKAKKKRSLIWCEICESAIRRERMDAHQLNHKNGKYKCEECNTRFTLLSFIWHQKRFHPEFDHRLITRKCGICEATLTTRKALKKHTRVHEIGNVKCELCNIRFTPLSLCLHQKRVHPNLEREQLKQQCEICKIICYNRATLDLHADMHRNGEYECETHKIKFTFKALRSHNKRYHPQLEPNAPCPICKVKFVKASYLEQHMNVHVNGDVKCEICNIRFTKNSLVHHQKIAHNKIYYGVPLSVRRMRQRLQKKQRKERMRLQTVTEAMRFQCKICKLLCGSDQKLRLHMQVHNDGDVECAICKIPFTKSSLAFHEKRFHFEEMRKRRVLKALQRHIWDQLSSLDESESKEIPTILEDHYKKLMTESKEPHKCLICNMVFTTAGHLDKHITTHIEGDYKCEICSAWFTKNALDIHQRRFHTEFYEERIKNGIRLVKEDHDVGMENQFSEKKTSSASGCEICKTSFTSKEHREMHATGNAVCKVCNIRFTEASLRYHQKRFHPELQPETIVEYNCKVCKLTCSDAKRLETHMTVHTEADTQCDICNIPFTKFSLMYHMKRFHPSVANNDLVAKALERNPPRTDVQPKVNQCRICGVTLSGRKLESHMRVHIDGDLKCHICQIWFTKASLDYHYKRFHPDVNVMPQFEKETTAKKCNEYKCNVCKMVVTTVTRLKEHLRTHRGRMKCPICNIRFTKNALIYHYTRFHPNVTKKDRILKSIENRAVRKNLHNVSCSKCGKSFTRICYLKLHMKTHRNAPEPVEIPFVFDEPTVPDSNDLLTVQQNDSAAETYECYLCNNYLSTPIELEQHLSQHVEVDSFSNRDSDELMGTTSEQPVVLVERLSMGNVNSKSMAAVNENHPNTVHDDYDLIESRSDNDVAFNSMTVEPPFDLAAVDEAEEDDDRNLLPDTSTQNDCNEIVELLSDSDDEDCETIQQRLHSNMVVPYKQELDLTANRNDESVYISSDDEDDDVTNLFHCFYCNGRFCTLRDFGEHQKCCFLKPEPQF